VSAHRQALQRWRLLQYVSCPVHVLFTSIKTSSSVVLAITKDNVDASPTLFKTYDRSESFKDCTIWQVARATSAATTFFKSIKCGRDDIEFIDAGFGYNNPCDMLLEEALEIFPTAGLVVFLASEQDLAR
jgi:patatin-like phospholipase/acyl hydrolase